MLQIVVMGTSKFSWAQAGHLYFFGVVSVDEQQSDVIIYLSFPATTKSVLLGRSQHNFHIFILSN